MTTHDEIDHGNEYRIETLEKALTHIIELYDVEGEAALTKNDLLWAMVVTAKKALSNKKPIYELFEGTNDALDKLTSKPLNRE